MLVPHLVLFLVLLSVACLVVLEVQIWVLLSAWLAVLQLERPLVVRLIRNPSSKENLFIEIDHTVIIILIRMEFTSNLHLFIPMTKSLILLILVMIGFMISMIGIIPEVTVLSSLEKLGQNYAYSSSLEIMNARFVDSNEDNTLNRNETAKVIFEIRNNGAHTLYDVVPTVIETIGNKHIFISPSVHVESIAPGHVIRYTAMVKADNRLKNGTACFCVSVIQGGKTISKVNQFDIPTKSR